MSERFQITDKDENVLVERNSMGRLILWLEENEYFQKNPGAVLKCQEMVTKDFEMEVTAETKTADIENAWKKFNGYI
ncbi:MAG: hypothetical protein J1E62_00130 [Lachnospiraceae bacterium]|nr:hypothetical protein [Lachnospiraceae bacterium]